MPKTADNCNEIERNNRISAEFQRINVFFEDLPENKKSIVMPLIQNAAFMRITLDDLQDLISKEGVVEQYRNGEHQFGMKQSAALQSYNALIKSFTAVIKKLFDLLPPEKRPSAYEVWKREQEQDEPDEEDDDLSDEERESERKDELMKAAAYQQWQREQGNNVRMSFEQWKREYCDD